MGAIKQDFINSRKHKRYHKNLRVNLHNYPTVLFIENISRGGFFLKKDEPLELDSEHQFTIQFDSGSYEFKAKVKWARGDPDKNLPVGTGMEFINPCPVVLSAIEEILEEVDLTHFAEGLPKGREQK